MVIVFAALYVLASGAEPSQRLELTGILKSDSGAAVKGATVFIHTAAPRQGTSSTCPSCYLDCRKKAQTNARGEFSIAALDPRLRFNLLVVARGHKAKIVPSVDPLAGPQSIAIERLDLAAIAPERIIRGHLTTPSGRPAVGAVVEVNGVRRGNTTSFGGDVGVDPVAVTDEKGDFVLLSRTPVSEVLVRIDGVGLARRTASFTANQLRLTEGVTVTGRVLSSGKPVPGVALGLVSRTRDSTTFLGDYEATSDDDGRFTFRNIPPRLEVYVYGKMESFGERGIPTTLARTTGDDGATLDLGAISTAPGRRVAGQVVLADGKPVPNGTRITVARRDAWDALEVVVRPDGTFRFNGVPPERVRIAARVRGHRFSFANPNLDWRSLTIEGRVDRDIDGLILVMEPGDHGGYSSDMKPPPGVDPDPSDKPLRPAKLPNKP